jgi:hypothetical protein
MSKPGVWGVGIGQTSSGNLGIVILVDKEERKANLPTAVEDLESDIRVVGDIKLHTINLGVSGGNNIVSGGICVGGTIGFKVCDNTNVSVGGLITNNHVAAAGIPYFCPNTAPLGTYFFSPGIEDNYCSTSGLTNVGTLDRFVPVVLDDSTANYVDAAFVQSSDAKLSNYINLIGYQNNTVATAQLYEYVCKSGRTSHLTCGQVTAVNLTMNLNYSELGPCGQTGYARLVQQIMYSPISPYTTMSQQGDSGSPVVDINTHAAVALNFAGDGVNGYGNLIGNVLSDLNVSLCGSIEGRTPPQPSMLVNGSYGPLSVSHTQPITLTISLNPEGYTNTNADWWAGRYNEGLNQLLFLNSSLQWTTQTVPLYQGPLFALGATSWNMGTLSPGTYEFTFGVDLTMDGILDNPLYYATPVVVYVY